MSTRKILFALLLFPLIGFSQLTEKDHDFLRQELSERINNLRASKGLKPLIFNDTLQKSAEFHSEYMAKNDVLSHDEKQSKYATPKKRVSAFDGKDFEIVGENVLYSTPQNFPLKKKDLIVLADEMFTSWKDSPGHYANMTEPEYVFGDLGFDVNLEKKSVYATQVFGTKGHVVPDQLSSSSFGLYQAPKECEKEFERYANIVLNLGNNLRIEGNEVVLYYHDIEYFKKMFSGSNDGIAIDLVSKDQLLCGAPNQLDFSPVYDGILLKPIFSSEMLENNRAESDYRVITKAGEIPDHLLGIDFSPSLIIIKSGKACKYLCPAQVSRKDYELRPIEPVVKDEPTIELLKTGVVRTQIVNYDFKTNITRSVDRPKIKEFAEKIHSVRINSFSSVEGDSSHNVYLHNSRADFIQKHVSSTLHVSSDKFSKNAKENWE